MNFRLHEKSKTVLSEALTTHQRAAPLTISRSVFPDVLCTFADGFCMFADGLCAFADVICRFADGLCTFKDELCTVADGVWPFADGPCPFADGLCAFADRNCGFEDGLFKSPQMMGDLKEKLSENQRASGPEAPLNKTFLGRSNAQAWQLKSNAITNPPAITINFDALTNDLIIAYTYHCSGWARRLTHGVPRSRGESAGAGW